MNKITLDYVLYKKSGDRLEYKLIKYIFKHISCLDIQVDDEDIYSFCSGENNGIRFYIKDSVMHKGMRYGDILRSCNRLMELFGGNVDLKLLGYTIRQVGMFDKQAWLVLEIDIIGNRDKLDILLKII